MTLAGPALVSCTSTNTHTAVSQGHNQTVMVISTMSCYCGYQISSSCFHVWETALQYNIFYYLNLSPVLSVLMKKFKRFLFFFYEQQAEFVFISSESACHGESCDDQVPAHHSESAVQSADQCHPGGCSSQRHQASLSEITFHKFHFSGLQQLA